MYDFLAVVSNVLKEKAKSFISVCFLLPLESNRGDCLSLFVICRMLCVGDETLYSAAFPYFQLPDDIVEDLQERFELQNVPSIIQELDNLSAYPRIDTFRVLDTLKDIHAKLTNFEARRSNDEANLEEDQIKFAKLFVQYGGEDVSS